MTAAILARLLAEKYRDDPDARRLAELLQPVAPGQRRPETRARRGERDVLIVGAVDAFYTDMAPYTAVKTFHADWTRYASTVWPRERNLSDCPARLIGTPRASFWELLQLEDRVLSASRILQVIENAQCGLQRAGGIR